MVLGCGRIDVDVFGGRLIHKGIGAMGNDTLSRRLGGALATATLVLAIGSPLALAGTEKIVICHAAGQAGTDNFATLELAPQAVYGNGGHFEENGTPRAGHVGDYLGPCVVEANTGSGATEAPEEMTETTNPAQTTTGQSEPDVSPSEVTTPTTSVLPDTGEVIDDPELGEDDELGASNGTGQPGDGGDDGTQVGAVAEVTDGHLPEDEEVEAAALPFTGVDPTWLLFGSLTLLSGATVVYLSGGSANAAGGHVEVNAEGFRFGFHRGRHESMQRPGTRSGQPE